MWDGLGNVHVGTLEWFFMIDARKMVSGHGFSSRVAGFQPTLHALTFRPMFCRLLRNCKSGTAACAESPSRPAVVAAHY